MLPPYGPDTVLAGFEAARLELDEVARELDDFAVFLAGHTTLDERRDVLPFFRAHRQLSLFLGSYDVKLEDYDRVAHEYRLWGQFTADLVVGDWSNKSYCFVEFEEAKRDSVFATTRRQTREWGSVIERGYSQIVDWFWLLDAERDTQTYEMKFGARRVEGPAS